MELRRLTYLLTFVSFFCFSQEFEEIEKQIEVYDIETFRVRQSSIYLDLFPTRFIGEQPSNTGFGTSIGIQRFYSSQLNAKFGIKYGNIAFNDSIGTNKNTNFYGVEGLCNLHFREIFKKGRGYYKVSPYLSAGFGIYASSSDHYQGQGQLNLSFPGAIGIDFLLTKKLLIGLNIGGALILSDYYDNNSSKAGGDIVLNPGITLKYIFKHKEIENRIYRTQTILVKREIPDRKHFPLYKEHPIYKQDTIDLKSEPLVEFVVKETEKEESTKGKEIEKVSSDLSSFGNWTYVDDVKEKVEQEIKESNSPLIKKETSVKEKEERAEGKIPILPNNHDKVFYTIQIASCSKIRSSFEEEKNLKVDFVVDNKEVGYYNHMVGFFESYREATTALTSIKSKVSGAFVVGIAYNKRVKAGKIDRLIMKDPNLLDLESSINQVLR